MKTFFVLAALNLTALVSHAQDKPRWPAKSPTAKSDLRAPAQQNKTATNQEPRAVVRAVRGHAEFKASKDGVWQVAAVGSVLNRGATIRTGGKSQTDLFLDANGPVVRVNEKSALVLETLAIDRSGPEVIVRTVLDLQKGEILGNVKKLSAQSRYEIKTPAGVVCRIRGTQYSITAEGTVTIIGGEAEVTYYVVGGPLQRAIVKGGETFTPSAGAFPTKPKL